MVVIVYLYGIYGSLVLQVQLHPLVCSVAFGKPVGLAVLVGKVCRLEVRRSLRSVPLGEALCLLRTSLLRRGSLYRLAVRKQHPARKGALLTLLRRCIMRIIAVRVVSVHDAVLVKESRKHTDASFPVDRSRHGHCREMPPVAVCVLNRAAVSCAVHKATRLVEYRIVLLISVRAKRRVGNVNTVPVNVEFGSGRSVLHIVAAVVLGHPGALDETAYPRVAVVLAEAFPSVRSAVHAEEFDGRAFDQEAVLHIEFLSAYRIYVGRAPEHICLAVIVDEQVRILEVVKYGRHGSPFAAERVIGVHNAHRTGRIAGHIEQRILVVMRRRSIASLRVPGALGLEEFPVDQVGRMPVAQRTGYEHIVVPLEAYYGWVGSGTVGKVAVRVVNHVGVVDVYRVAVGRRLPVTPAGGEGKQCGGKDAGVYYSSHSKVVLRVSEEFFPI